MFLNVQECTETGTCANDILTVVPKFDQIYFYSSYNILNTIISFPTLEIFQLHPNFLRKSNFCQTFLAKLQGETKVVLKM